MKFKWKLLLVLLVVALLPLMAMRLVIEDADEESARILAERFGLGVSMGKEMDGEDLTLALEDILIARNESEMLSTARRSARTAGDRFRLISQMQREQLRILQGETPLGSDSADGKAHGGYWAWSEEGKRLRLKVDFASADQVAEGQDDPAEGNHFSRNALAAFRYGKQSLPRLALWQWAESPGGAVCLYPGLTEDMADVRQALASLARQAGGANLSVRPSPATRELLLLSSLRSDGRDASSVTTAAAMSDLFDRRDAVDLPDRVQWFFVQEDGAQLRVLASRVPDDDPQSLFWGQGGSLPDLPAEQGSTLLTGFEDGGYGSFRTGAGDADHLWVYSGLGVRGLGVILGLSVSSMLSESLQAERFVNQTIWVRHRTMMLVILALGLLTLATALTLSNTMTRRMERLAEAFRKVAAGDFSVRARVGGKDELAQLGATFDEMVPALDEQVRMKQDMAVARGIQQCLMPEDVPSVPGLDVAGISIPHDETGGDYYDFFTFDNGEVGAIVGDVTGHGIPAALLMASSRAFIRANLDGEVDSGRVLTRANDLLSQDIQMTGRSMTSFFCLVDPQQRAVRWSRAGHDPAIVYLPGTGAFEELAGDSGLPLGVMDGMEYVEDRRILPEGAVVFFGTDGVWETHGQDGELFGKDRIRDLLKSNATLSASDIAKTVVSSVRDFAGEDGVEDDLTLIVLKLS
ncbi:SpoIIE family protein phosphatase [uncultured Pseudodesulfovibrio sp.]|uniref:PP2C family protein-serine/threonine phosphatase n=1 Tax=uncultured Pseudodesulfovibrio sp. TaxID=2035858 RepID=UPI0029C67619|nr:SpoIIE family protein phosphatase [uncultured Pseudodesulfovibrio sp.]